MAEDYDCFSVLFLITVIGNGGCGYSGEAVAGTSCYICNPGGVFVDRSGNVYATDSSYGRIRYMNVGEGLVYTVIGGGSSSVDGLEGTATMLQFPVDVFVDSASNIYVADSNDYSVRKLSASNGLVTTVAGVGSLSFGGDGGPASSAQLWSPTNIWVSDY